MLLHSAVRSEWSSKSCPVLRIQIQYVTNTNWNKANTKQTTGLQRCSTAPVEVSGAVKVVQTVCCCFYLQLQTCPNGLAQTPKLSWLSISELRSKIWPYALHTLISGLRWRFDRTRMVVNKIWKQGQYWSTTSAVVNGDERYYFLSLKLRWTSRILLGVADRQLAQKHPP